MGAEGAALEARSASCFGVTSSIPCPALTLSSHLMSICILIHMRSTGMPTKHIPACLPACLNTYLGKIATGAILMMKRSSVSSYAHYSPAVCALITYFFVQATGVAWQTSLLAYLAQKYPANIHECLGNYQGRASICR